MFLDSLLVQSGLLFSQSNVFMQLFYFLVVIVSLSCGSLPGVETGWMFPVIATAGVVAFWSLLCYLGAGMIARQVKTDQLDPVVGARWLEKQLEIFRWISLAVIVLCLAGFGLARIIETAPIMEYSMFLQAIVLLAPGLVMTIATWSAEQYYGVYLGYTDRRLKSHFAIVWSLFRSRIGWLIAPVLMILALSDLVGLLPIGEGAGSLLIGTMMVLFILVGLPILIRRLFKTSPLTPDTESWMCDLLTAAGAKGTRPVRWDTNQQSFNAMVAGFFPRFRSLLVSDRLVDELTQEQIAMVVLHEAAHLKRRHVPLRMLSLLPAWIAGAAISSMLAESAWAAPWALAIGSAFGILMTLLILRIVAYRSEYDADLQACKMAERFSGSVPGCPTSYAAAADVLGDALLRVTADSVESRNATWLHPSVSDRIASMRRHRSVPQSSNASAGTIANPA